MSCLFPGLRWPHNFNWVTSVGLRFALNDFRDPAEASFATNKAIFCVVICTLFESVVFLVDAAIEETFVVARLELIIFNPIV